MSNTPKPSLETASEQEIFDFVANHLFTQGKPAVTVHTNTCSYRTADGLSCAAGCLLTDDQYSPAFEGRSWDSLVECNSMPKIHVNLIAGLQRIHDAWLEYYIEGDLGYLNYNLNKLANDHNLQFTPRVS